MARKLREHAPTFHTTESDVDRPKLGDVRIEEGIARDKATGEVLALLVRHKKTDRVLRGDDVGTIPPHELEVVRPEQRAHKVYRFVERPLSGEYGLYAHEDNSDLRGTPKDEEGFFLDPNGERIARYVRPVLGEDGQLQYTDESRTRYVAEPDPHYWEIVDEHPDLEAAKQIAEQHL